MPELLITTIQRFGFDLVSESYKKDSNPMHFPVCMDLFQLKKLDYEDKKELYDNNQLMREYIEVTSMPWLYF